ncbi:hypothetical protein FPZ54_17475 [Sphingomonas suaedae]|uniref:Rap1a immunity protein domain-containing protein n=1 Tax=Sphingomonas suaedae TaxID=2599297 RepID=A0A518RJL1_9SPHN|nr:hypothetical protein [Sphingomonas suaedae]QDX27620.1 hypothetical protein FPZ54_17475 [Sphingomonas suaedae]
MLRPLILALALVALPAAAQDLSPSTVTLGQFLVKVDEVEARGAQADDPELLEVTSLMGAVASSYRQRLVDIAASGQAAPACPPPPGKAVLDSDIIIPKLKALPTDQRDRSLQNAMWEVMDALFPCT